MIESIRREYLIKEEIQQDLPEGSLVLIETPNGIKTEMSVLRVSGGDMKGPIKIIIRTLSNNHPDPGKITFANTTTGEGQVLTLPPGYGVLHIKLQPVVAITGDKVRLDKIPNSHVSSILDTVDKQSKTD